MTLDDVNRVQEETANAALEISKLDKEVEGILFEPAKKDKHSKSVYEKFVELKEVFNKFIENVQLQAKLQLQIREIEEKVENFKGKYKDFQESSKIDEDLKKIIAENEKIKARLTQEGG